MQNSVNANAEERGENMLGLLIVLASGAAAGYFSYLEWGLGWGISCALLGALLAIIIIWVLLYIAISKRYAVIQGYMVDAQNKVNRQLEMFNRRPPSSMNAARQILEKIQFEGIRQSLTALDGLKKFYIWNPLLYKQVNTNKVQLYYQLREYDKVDALLPKSIVLDVRTVGIKLARMYKKNDSALDKFYQSRCRRFKGEDGAFIASVYAWMKVKQNEPEKALDALRIAKKTSDNPILLENIDRLTNGKYKHYSNSGFGDVWYLLALEEPKVKNQRQTRAF